MLGETIASALALEETSFVMLYKLYFDVNEKGHKTVKLVMLAFSVLWAVLTGVVFPLFLPVLCVFKREKQPGWLGEFTPLKNQFLSGALAGGNAVDSGVLATLPQAPGVAHNQKKD